MTDIAPTILDRVQHITARLTELLDGDVDASTLTRSMYSTDASNYRVVPDIVVLPQNSDAVVAGLDVAREHSLAMPAPGGGTSMARHLLTPGPVLGCPKYMNKLMHLD